MLCKPIYYLKNQHIIMIIIYAVSKYSVYFALAVSINISSEVITSYDLIFSSYINIYSHPPSHNTAEPRQLRVSGYRFFFRNVFSYLDFFGFEYRYLYFLISISGSRPDLMNIVNHRGKSKYRFVELYFGPLRRLRDTEVPLYYIIYFISVDQDLIFSGNLPFEVLYYVGNTRNIAT